jgi:hypothetical protein
MEAAAPPPPDVVVDLRRWRDGVADLLAARQRRASAPPAPPLEAAPAWPDGFLYLSGLAVRLDAALRDGATVTRCPSGALDVTLTDGSPWLLSPSVVARLEAGRLLPATAPNLPAPGAREVPAAEWRELPYGAERGVAFAEARVMPGACPCCAGRRWWREADEAPPGRCMACHPPPPGLAVTVTETRAGTYQPGDPDPLRDGLLRGARDHRNPR